jgi:hypothetical protein
MKKKALARTSKIIDGMVVILSASERDPSTFQALHSTFFAEARHDAFSGDSRAAMAPYDIPLQANADVLLPEQVKTVEARAQRVPTAFLLYQEGRLHVYLQLDKFRRSTSSVCTHCLSTVSRRTPTCLFAIRQVPS